MDTFWLSDLERASNICGSLVTYNIYVTKKKRKKVLFAQLNTGFVAFKNYLKIIFNP